VESGIVGRSFVAVPLAWGFAIFESIMGIPMAGASVLGGLLYRQSYRLPFVVVAVLATSLLIGLAVWPRGWRRGRASPPAPTSTR